MIYAACAGHGIRKQQGVRTPHATQVFRFAGTAGGSASLRTAQSRRDPPQAWPAF